MTRQPSTRTAEPRTAAGRDLLATAYLAGDAASEGVSLLDAILAIEAEAADLRVPEEGEGLAPAGLDVEALANAYKRLASQRHSLSEQPVHMEHVFSECPHPDCLAARAAGW